MQRVSVSNDGTKTYSVVSGIALPSGTRNAKTDNAKYAMLLTMQPGEVIFVSTPAERTAIMQAFSGSKIYESARKVGKLVSKDLAKYAKLGKKDNPHELGTPGKEFGIWMVAHTEPSGEGK